MFIQASVANFMTMMMVYLPVTDFYRKEPLTGRSGCAANAPGCLAVEQCPCPVGLNVKNNIPAT